MPPPPPQRKKKKKTTFLMGLLSPCNLPLLFPLSPKILLDSLSPLLDGVRGPTVERWAAGGDGEERRGRAPS